MSHSDQQGLVRPTRGAKLKIPKAQPASVVHLDIERRLGLKAWQHRHPKCERPLNWKWASALPAFGRAALNAVYDMSEPGGIIDSRSTALSYQAWTKPFFLFMSGVWNEQPEHRAGVDTAHLPLEAYIAFKRHVDERVASGAIKSKTGYGYKGAITRILRWIWDADPGSLGPEWIERAFVHDEFEDDFKQREPYSAAEARRLLDAIVDLLQNRVANGRAEIADAWDVELACYTALALRLGIETECLDQLKVGDVRPSSDGETINIRYLKKRAPSNPRRSRKVNTGSSTEHPAGSLDASSRKEQIGGLKSAGGVLALLLRRAALVEAAAGTSLWSRRFSAQDFRRFTELLEDRGLRCDYGGTLKVDRTKFRVTYKSAKNVRHKGMLGLMPEDNSRDVNARHYLESERLKPYYEQAIVDAGNQALAYALEPLKVVPLGEEAGADEIAHAADAIGVPPAEVAVALTGETDVWISSCRDFYNSPFDAPGRPCSKAFYGCLGCRNALITRRVLPRILRFYSHINTQRQLLPDADWRAKFGLAHERITNEVLPRFPRPILEEARIIAQGVHANLHLPPELLG